MNATVLSQREKEIAGSLALGKTRKEVSETLFIAPSTAVTHTKNIYAKTGSHNLADITRLIISDALGKSVSEIEKAVQSYISKNAVKLVLMTLFVSLNVFIIYVDTQNLARTRTLKAARKASKSNRIKDTYYA